MDEIHWQGAFVGLGVARRRAAAAAAREAAEEEADLLQARREVFDLVLVLDRGAGVTLEGVHLYRDVPRHSLAFFLPDHTLAMAASEQVLKG